MEWEEEEVEEEVEEEEEDKQLMAAISRRGNSSWLDANGALTTTIVANAFSLQPARNKREEERKKRKRINHPLIKSKEPQ